MRIQEWIVNNITYRFLGCGTVSHDQMLEFICAKIPKSFLNKKMCDLGCGDGINTVKLKKIFQAKDIIGYEWLDFLLERAKQKGLKVKKMDLNNQIPQGELATFMLALHHLRDKEEALTKVKENFKYIFLCEPCLNLYEWIFDGGTTLKRDKWVELFDRVLERYDIYQWGNYLIVFYDAEAR